MDLTKIAAIFEQAKEFKGDITRLTFVRKHIAIPVVNKQAPGNARIRALSGWDANASQIGNKYVYRVIDSYVNIEGEKITGVPAAPGDINATPSSIEAKINRLLNYRALPRKLVKGPANRKPATNVQSLVKKLRAKYAAPINEGKQEVEEPRRRFITSDDDDVITIKGDAFRNTRDVKQKAEQLIEVGKTIITLGHKHIINASTEGQVCRDVARDICTAIHIDYSNVRSQLNRIAPNILANAFDRAVSIACEVYKEANGNNLNLLMVKRPVHFAAVTNGDRAKVDPSLLNRINAIYPRTDRFPDGLPPNTTMKRTSLPPMIVTVDSKLLVNEVAKNPSFVNGFAHGADNRQFIIYNDPSHLIATATEESEKFYDMYFDAFGAANLMRGKADKRTDKRTPESGYISDTYGAEMMFAVIKTDAQAAANDNSFTYQNLGDIRMRRGDDYAQFHHQYLDYTYCSKANSPYFGKFIPAEHPCLEFMESPDYIPNACVLSTFISALNYEGKCKVSYERLLELAEIVPTDTKNKYPAKRYLKTVRSSATPEIPISLPQFDKICHGLKVYARVFTTDGVCIGEYGKKNPKERSREHRAVFSFIYAGNHLYYCSNDKIQTIAERWADSKQPSLVPKMPDGIYHCTPQVSHITSESQVTEWGDVDSMLQDPTKWKDTMVFKGDVDLIDAFFAIWKKTGLITLPTIRGSKVRRLSGRHTVNKKSVPFTIVSNISEKGIRISDPKEYVQYDTMSVELNNLMITHGHRSDYTEETRPIFESATTPFIGRLDSTTGMFNLIDCSKHYTAEAMRIPKIPVFGPFDHVQYYAEDFNADDVALEDMTVYLVKCPSDAFLRFGPAAPELYKGYYGYIVKDLIAMNRSASPILIQGELKPTILAANPLEEYFADKEFNAPLKRAANETWGKLGISEQSEEHTLVYVDNKEASAALNAAKQIPNIKAREYPLGDGITALQIETEKVKCTNGFLPIKKAIYDSSRIAMLKLFDMMLNAGLTPRAVNTDAIYYSGDATNLIIALDENNMIGKAPNQYNISAEPTDISRYPVAYTYDRPMHVVKPVTYAPRITYHESAVCDADWVLDETFHHDTNKILLHGEFPGVGKSHTSLQVATRVCTERNGRAIFCAPFNEHLLDNFAEYNKIGTCKTSASFFSMYLAKDMTLAVHNEAKELMIPEDVVVIIFDEVYLNNINVLTQILRLMQRRPDLMYVFNGDYYGQMKAIANYNKSDIIKLAIDQITAGGKELILTEIKRNKHPRYKEFVIRLRETKTMFSKDRIRELVAICDEFNIKCVSDPHEIKNFDRAIAWRNVDKLALNQLKCRQIDVGAKIRCNDAFKCLAFNGIETRDAREKLTKGTIHADFRKGDAYEVMAVEEKQVVIRPIDGTEYKCKAPIIAIPRKYMGNFGVHFSKTAHGYQGATIRGKVLICDLFTEHELKPEAYNYVALTRNTNLEDIYVYTGPAGFDLKRSEHAIHDLDTSKQICKECFKVLRAHEHGPKAAKCVYCERIEKNMTN